MWYLCLHLIACAHLYASRPTCMRIFYVCLCTYANAHTHAHTDIYTCTCAYRHIYINVWALHQHRHVSEQKQSERNIHQCVHTEVLNKYWDSLLYMYIKKHKHRILGPCDASEYAHVACACLGPNCSRMCAYENENLGNIAWRMLLVIEKTTAWSNRLSRWSHA